MQYYLKQNVLWTKVELPSTVSTFDLIAYPESNYILKLKTVFRIVRLKHQLLDCSKMYAKIKLVHKIDNVWRDHWCVTVWCWQFDGCFYLIKNLKKAAWSCICSISRLQTMFVAVLVIYYPPSQLKKLPND